MTTKSIKDTEMEDQDIRIDINEELNGRFRTFFKKEGLIKTQVDLITLLLKVSGGKVYFKTTLNILAEEFDPTKTTTSKGLVQVKKGIGERLHNFERWQDKKGKEFIKVLGREPGGRREFSQQLKPDIIKCEFIVLKKLVNINNNSNLKSNEEKFQELHEKYLHKKK